LHYVVSGGTSLPDTRTPDCPASIPFCITTVKLWNCSDLYGVMAHPGIFSMRGITNTRLRDITDGTSNTFLMGERNAELCQYGGGAWSFNFPGAFSGQKPNSPTQDKTSPTNYTANAGFSSHHVGGLQMLLADGSVKFISSNIDFPTWCYMSDKADGNITSVE